jgi:hypothetical protein
MLPKFDQIRAAAKYLFSLDAGPKIELCRSFYDFYCHGSGFPNTIHIPELIQTGIEYVPYIPKFLQQSPGLPLRIAAWNA